MPDEAYRTDSPVEDIAVKLLDKGGLVVSTAESCTGGLLAGRIVNVPGASNVYKAGFITYSNKAKRRYLGVRKGTLKKYGAVSKQTAGEMVKGLVAETGADVGLATTGIAGPGGGSDEKPVGLVYIGCSVCGRVRVKKFVFDGDRMKVRESAVMAALDLMIKCVEEYYTENKSK